MLSHRYIHKICNKCILTHCILDVGKLAIIASFNGFDIIWGHRFEADKLPVFISVDSYQHICTLACSFARDDLSDQHQTALPNECYLMHLLYVINLFSVDKSDCSLKHMFICMHVTYEGRWNTCVYNSLTYIDKFNARHWKILALGKFVHGGFKSPDWVYSQTCKVVQFLVMIWLYQPMIH